ncbi:hypothetical protein [Empedobacter tilapiae]|uniref:hypothetical protein n=1 Tax=Empedobacter tilapiae TaxID=2491114 RepID=UPI0028D5595C|nr:hypothetical protein [Empedobacter tilapiae]
MLKKYFIFLLFLPICITLFSQEHIFKNTCYIGEEVHTQSFDTIQSKEKLDLLFYNKHFDLYTPTFFPDQLVTKTKQTKPRLSKTKEGYIVEYFNEKNQLIKYSYDMQPGNFDVHIVYSDKDYPVFLVESFLNLGHVYNLINSVSYNLKYNTKGEVIYIEMIDYNNYICELEKIN